MSSGRVIRAGPLPVSGRRALPASIALLLVTTAASSMAAQAPGARPALDTLFSIVGRVDSVSLIEPARARCVAMSGRVKALCEAFIKLRVAELSGTAADALRADDAFRAVHFYEEKWPYVWYGLGLTRILMARTRNIAREGPLQPPGVTNEAAASHAFVRALELDSSFALAAEALAMAPVPREGASQMAKRLTMLRRVRGWGTQLSPMAWAMMGVVERIAGSPDSAAASLRRALDVGADPGFVAYELARALYLGGRPDEGRRALLAGGQHSRSPLGRTRFDRTVRMVGSPGEFTAWDSLAPTDRPRWFADFWNSRDVRDGRAEGESLIEHFRRVEETWRRYRVDIPRTGRHKDNVASDHRNEGAPALIDGFSDGIPGGALDATPVTDIFVDSYRIDAPFRTFTLPDDQLDDRGVIYIRHGDPAATGITAGLGGPDLELWRYDLPGGPRFFAFREVQFDGTSGAGVLTPQLATAPNRQQLCAIDERLCYPTTGREMIQATNMRAEGLESIRIGTTTDAHLRTFTRRIAPVVQIYGLDRAEGGAPRLVSAFAIPATSLAHSSPPEAGGRTIYSVRLQLMVVSRDGVRSEVDTTRHFATARPLGAGESITGFIELPVGGGLHTASLVVTQADGRGAVAALGSVTTPGGTSLGLSDIVLGREGSGVRWNSGATLVPLNPLNAYAVRADAELYYQVRGLVRGREYETRIEFLENGAEEKPPRLAFSFREEAGETRREVQRTVSLGELAPGRYRLRVTILADGQRVSSSSLLTVTAK